MASTWTVTPTPVVKGAFFGAAAVSSTDAWAFGQQRDPTGFSALAEHWDGTAWKIVATPALSSSDPNQPAWPLLNAGFAFSASDAWAVGFDENFLVEVGGIIEHWDGRSWQLVSHPASDLGLGTQLNAVSAVSPSDIWVVGSETITAGGQSQTVALHYDGESWTRMVPYVGSGGPEGSSFSDLFCVKAVATDDVWALGEDYNSPIALHWNGTAWTVVPFPAFTSADATYAGAIDGAASDDIWAFGHYLVPAGYEGGESAEAMAWHWDGQSWSYVTDPDPQHPTLDLVSGAESAFSGVTALAKDNVWTTGVAGLGGNSNAGVQYFLHYDGTAWSAVVNSTNGSPGPNGGYDGGGNPLASSPDGDVWAVGAGSSVPSDPFAVHYAAP
jgi:hypothetical protein